MIKLMIKIFLPFVQNLVSIKYKYFFKTLEKFCIHLLLEAAKYALSVQ
jgi:hypothetical protein